MNYSKIGHTLYREILTHPNVKDPVIWASWLVPMVVTPVGRYFSDDKREQSDRLGLSVELFSLYAVGTALYFLFNPVAGLASKKLFPHKTKAFHALASGVAGSFVSALYSAFGANKVANFLKPHSKNVPERKSNHANMPKDYRIDASSGTPFSGGQYASGVPKRPLNKKLNQHLSPSYPYSSPYRL